MILPIINSFKMECIWNSWRIPFFWRILPLVAFMVGILIVVAPALGQEVNQWSPQRTIPGYHPETEPPVLIADQNGTVHAISSQWLGDQEDPSVKKAVVYNQWTSEGGWTSPIDILLSPQKREARLLDAFMDQSGMMHVVFFGGDGDGANIYYSKAPANRADQAPSWSKPDSVGINARDPADGGILGDGEGNLMILYAGDGDGVGWYTVASSDNGNTWSEETLFFPTYFEGFSPFYFRTHRGDSGLHHAVWSVNDRNNAGRAIYYANFDFATMRWSEPLQLAEQKVAETLGTQAPEIIEYDDSLFVTYYDNITRHQHIIRSSDGGQSWSQPDVPFPHEGLNGPGYFVVDSNDVLHYFWAQRVRLTTDIINGLWHTTWQDTEWSDFEAVVMGYKVIDHEGFNAFDPNTPHVAVSGGNRVLATWRSDRGSRGNGVWYSTKVIDAPALPTLPLPTVPSALVTDNTALVIDNSANSIIETPVPIGAAIPEFRDEVDFPDVVTKNPAEGLVIGFVPVVLLILSIFIVRQLSQNRNRS